MWVPGKESSRQRGQHDRDPEVGTVNRQRLLKPQFGDQDRECHMMRSDRLAEARTAEPYKLW